MIGENAGIVLGPNKRQLVQGRLARRLRELGLPSYEAYCDHVRESGPEELVGLINALTTNVTAFFRENHHFEALASFMMPEALKRNAGVAPHSSLERRLLNRRGALLYRDGCERTPAACAKWDLKILATDIDSDVIAAAQTGVYPLDRLAAVSKERLQRCFQQGRRRRSGNAVVKPSLRSLITFRTLNLLHSWPMRGPFDVIFCRNVMIYFDQSTRERLVNRFAQLLAPGGYLCLGHSESIHGGATPLRLVGKTIYRKAGGEHVR